MTQLRGVALLLGIGLSLAAAPAALAQRFYPDDPIRVDPDDLPMEKPGSIELSGGWDVIENTFGFGTPEGPASRARNINTLGEVPDSSWFTNRIGRREMTIEELVRGPDHLEGDAPHPWTIIRGKSEGITPGFTIEDGRGDVYFIKFDPPDYPGMATSADVIGTKFFYAIGFNVPENYIAYLSPDQLTISPEATISGGGRKDAPMTQADLDAIFERVHPREDGTYRVIASLRLSGRPLGPFKHFGVRPDDPNDIFPHEDRRELRGYRLFCAWLNHDDSRSLNTLDMYVPRPDGTGSHVKHYLIDFASILGSGSVIPQNPRAGNEYVVALGPMAKAFFSLGIWDRAWRKVEYPDYPEIGNFEADFFSPELWRPEHPNQAFLRMQNEDAFWATRIISRFSDEAVRALVHTGEFEDPEAEHYLADCLIKRRDKIVEHYLALLNPLHDFEIAGEQLVFANLGRQSGLGTPEAYEHRWFAFDNEAETSEPLGEASRVGQPRIPLPATASEHDILRVQIRSHCPTRPAWSKAVDVYLRTGETGFEIVGIDRQN